MNMLTELLSEYKRVYRSLAKAKERTEEKADQEIIGEMMSSTQFVVEWLEKGYHPDNRRGIHRRSMAQRTVALDPMWMQSFASPASCGSYTTLSDYERFQIEDALSELTEQERQVYTLHYGLGFSLRQIAMEMDRTKSTIQTHLERAEEKIARRKQNSFFLTG